MFKFLGKNSKSKTLNYDMLYSNIDIVNKIVKLSYSEKMNLVKYLNIVDEFNELIVEEPKKLFVEGSKRPYYTNPKYAKWYDMKNAKTQNEYYIILVSNRITASKLLKYCEAHNLVNKLISRLF